MQGPPNDCSPGAPKGLSSPLSVVYTWIAPFYNLISTWCCSVVICLHEAVAQLTDEQRWWRHRVRCCSNCRYVLACSQVCAWSTDLPSTCLQVIESVVRVLGIEKWLQCSCWEVLALRCTSIEPLHNIQTTTRLFVVVVCIMSISWAHRHIDIVHIQHWLCHNDVILSKSSQRNCSVNNPTNVCASSCVRA